MSDESNQKSVFVDKDTQKNLNEPLQDPSGISGEDEKFLEFVMKLISDGKIDLYKAETLVNQEVYKNLSEEQRGKVDFESVNLLSSIREIQDLYENGFEKSFQIQNQVHRLREIKNRLEDESGDLFII